MTKDLIKRIHRLYGIALSIMLVITGVCFMAACVGIYRSGDQPFSRESVAAAFGPIALPVCLCLVMILISFVLKFFLPDDCEKQTPEKQHAAVLKRLHAKTDLTHCDEATRRAIAAEQKKRRLHRIVSITLLSACSGIFLSYGLNSSHFHQSQINESMIRAMYWLIPCMAVPFGYDVFAAYSDAASIRREIELLKQVKAAKPAEKQEHRDYTKRINLVRGVIVLAAVAILVYGFCTGGTADVLTKAINICTECVGLG